MPEPEPRKLFYEKVFERLMANTTAIGAEVPEVEAIASVVLWRVPDQRGIPSLLVQGVDGPLTNPDQYLRLRIAVLLLEQYTAEKGLEGVAALRDYAERLAKGAMAIHEQRKDDAGREPAGEAAPGLPADPAG